MASREGEGGGLTGGKGTRPSGNATALPPARHRFLLWLVVWLILYAVSLLAYNHYHPLVSEWLVRRLQVNPSVMVLEWMLPGQPIVGDATAIRTTGLELQILRGCDGIEAWLLLVTALAVFPLSCRRRAWGVLIGSVMMLVLNVARIVSLFLIALRRPAWMDVAHGFIWQSAIVLAAAVFVLIWTEPRMGRSRGQGPQP